MKALLFSGTHEWKQAFSISNSTILYEMCCAIWYYLYNLKNVKNNHGVVLLFVKLQAEVFAIFKLYKGIKSRNALHMIQYRKYGQTFSIKQSNKHNINHGGFPTNDLRVSSYKVIAQVTSHFLYRSYKLFTAWKVFVSGVFLVRIFPHLDWLFRANPEKKTDLKNSKRGHFSRSDYLLHKLRFNFYVLVTSYVRVTS